MKKVLMFSLIGLLMLTGCNVKEESATKNGVKKEETDAS